MDGQKAVFFYGLVMGLGAVALVFAKAICGIEFVPFPQEPVPAHFGQDWTPPRCWRTGRPPLPPSPRAGPRAAYGCRPTRTHPGTAWRLAQARSMAKKVACRMLISSISWALAQPTPQARAFSWIRGNSASRFFLRELFGVVEALYAAVQGQDDGGRAHRPRQGAPAGLVNAADRAVPRLCGSAFPGEPVRGLRLLKGVVATKIPPLPARWARRLQGVRGAPG